MRNLIFGLARPMMRLLGRDERGAVGVLVAIFIAGGVLLGMGALVIDVGQLYQNQAELQNGADAAALAIAKSCSEGSCTPAIATSYADANASGLTGGTAYVTFVCGLNGTVAVGTGACGTGNKHCVANPPSGTNYVDVETSTELSNGSHLLPPVFARTLAGNGNYQGTTVYSCSQAEWGSPLIGNTVGITLGYCDWTEATSNGTSYPSAPPYPPNPSSLPIVIDFHDPAGQETDTNYPSGPARPVLQVPDAQLLATARAAASAPFCSSARFWYSRPTSIARAPIPSSTPPPMNTAISTPIAPLSSRPSRRIIGRARPNIRFRMA